MSWTAFDEGTMRTGTLCTMLLGVSVLGCGGGDDNPPMTVPMSSDASVGMRNECEDEDGDGRGPYCAAGLDCDDSDPDVTDICFRCADPESPGCPCEKGTRPVWCKPDDRRVVQDGVAGTLVCSEGTRYCREEVWTECEMLLEYAIFMPD